MYFLFISMATGLILSPGPGVLKSINNSINYGIRQAGVGVFGLVSGVFFVSMISATSLGVLLSSSATLFAALKYAGVGYMFYLGWNTLQRSALPLDAPVASRPGSFKIFSEGVLLQLANPNALIFFFSVLPQFIDPKTNYQRQFICMALIFCTLMAGIHMGYVLVASKAKVWLNSHSRLFNQISAGLFFGFGLLFLC